MLPFTLDTARLSLHILAVCIWIGGQLVVAAAVPVLREVGADAPRLVARRFGQVAWPAFGLAVVTGIWSILTLPSRQSFEYNVTLGVKLLLVVGSGVAAFVHQQTSSPALRGATGGLGLVSALGALVLGVML
jgi:putative copper export protein